MTPKGEGICYFVLDYGLETELYWNVFIQETGESWLFSNIDVRLVENKTLRRGRPMTNWIKGATKNKNGLHKSLGVPEGKKIPESKIKAAASRSGKVGKQARLAETLSKIRKK